MKNVTYSENSSQASLWQFKTVIETGDVRYLLILDNYDEFPECEIDLLVDVWNKIYKEFSDIAGGNRADLYLVKVIRLSTMQLHLHMHSIILNMVKVLPLPEIIEEAKKEGYIIDVANFEKTLEKAYTRLMRLKREIDINEKQKARDEEEKEDQSLEPLIADLEKFQGYQFDEYKMSVKKFASIYKKYKDGKVHS